MNRQELRRYLLRNEITGEFTIESEVNKMTNNAKINGFLTNLSDYNNGTMTGRWVSFPMTEKELAKALESVGIDDEHEYFFTDWDCEIDCEFGEFENILAVNELARELEEVEDIDHLEAYIEATGYELKEAIENYESSTFYPNMELIDIAYEIVNDCYNLPEFALTYFDYEAFARDLSFDGYTETENGTICMY